MKSSVGYLLPLPQRRWLLWAPQQQIAAVVNDSAKAFLLDEHHREAPAASDLLNTLQRAPILNPQKKSGELNPHFLGLTTTRGCNIGCVYCNFGGPTADNRVMPIDTAMTAIDWMVERLLAENRDLFRLHFFGGEPLVAWELVELAVHRVRQLCSEQTLQHYIDASTNGVMSDQRLQFVGDYFGGVVLSFDGPARYQDRNRPTKKGKSTFDAVDHAAMVWRDMPLDLCLRVCITADSVDSMIDITRWMCERYQPTVINFETLTPGDLAFQAGLRVPDPFAFARGFIGAHREAKHWGVRAVYSAAEYGVPRRSFCPVGTDSPIVAPDGRVNACYLLEEDWQTRNMDMSMGHIERGRFTRESNSVNRVREIPNTKARCENCFCQWSCAGGCHVNQTYPSSTDTFTDFCEQTRVVTAALILDELGHFDLVDALLQDDVASQQLAYAQFKFTIDAPDNPTEFTPESIDRRPLHEQLGILQ